MAYIPHPELDLISEKFCFSAHFLPVALAIDGLSQGQVFYQFQVRNYMDTNSTVVNRVAHRLRKLGLIIPADPNESNPHVKPLLKEESIIWEGIRIWPKLLGIDPVDLFDQPWSEDFLVEPKSYHAGQPEPIDPEAQLLPISPGQNG